MLRRILVFLFLCVALIGGGIFMMTAISGGGRADRALAAPRAVPSLIAASMVPAGGGSAVTLPLDFANGGFGIDTMFFVLSYDATLLSLDLTDSNNDDIPDDLVFDLPENYVTVVETPLIGNEGRIQVLIYGDNPAVEQIPPGRLLDVIFEAAFVASPQVTDVFFLSSPQPFFLDNSDAVVDGDFIDGSIFIQPSLVTATASATATQTVTATPSPSPTPTTTVSGTPPSPTATFTPTTTATPTTTSTATTTATPSDTPTVTDTPTATTTATATDVAAATPTATLALEPVDHFLPLVLNIPPPPPTATPTATATATATPTVVASATPRPTATPTRGPGQCVDVVTNGGFENNDGWKLNNTVYPAGYVAFPVFSGARALRAGIVHPPDNIYSYSSAQQTIFIPAGPPAVKLSFRLFATTTGTVAARLTPPTVVPTSSLDRTKLADDVQMVLLFDNSGRQHVLLFQRQWYSDWRLHEIDLSAFRGQAVTLYFGVFNNGTGGVTGMYVDEVAVKYCLP